MDNEQKYQAGEQLPYLPEGAEKPAYEPRPKWQVIWARVMVVIVIAAFLGYCYWIARS